MSIDPSLYLAYIGPNRAHMTFKQEMVNAKVLLFQFQGNRDHLRGFFEERIEHARQAAPESFAIGIVTETLSPTQVRILNIPHNEAELVAHDYKSLEAQLHSLLYIDLQRILESYLIDLYAEVARNEPRVLTSNRTVTFEEVLKAPNLVELLLEKQLVALSHSDRDGFERQFADMGLSLLDLPEVAPVDRPFIVGEFALLWAMRNILQHNHGVINDLFLAKVPEAGYKRGDAVSIDVGMLGRAFAAVECVADSVNRRAVVKYGLGPQAGHAA